MPNPQVAAASPEGRPVAAAAPTMVSPSKVKAPDVSCAQVISGGWVLPQGLKSLNSPVFESYEMTA